MDIFYDLPDLNRIFPAIRLHTAAAVNTEWCKRGNGFLYIIRLHSACKKPWLLKCSGLYDQTVVNGMRP